MKKSLFCYLVAAGAGIVMFVSEFLGRRYQYEEELDEEIKQLRVEEKE